MSARRRSGGPGRLLPLRAAIEGRRSKPHDWPGADPEARAVSFRCVRRSRAGGRSRMIGQAQIRRPGPSPSVACGDRGPEVEAAGLARRRSAAPGRRPPSSSEAEWVLPLLERIGLHASFRHVVTTGSELRPKPAPDTYLEACLRLGVEPAHALAIEDSPHGIAAAKTAGLRCVAVPHELTETLDLSAADMRLGSLAECSLADAIARLAR